VNSRDEHGGPDSGRGQAGPLGEGFPYGERGCFPGAHEAPISSYSKIAQRYLSPHRSLGLDPDHPENFGSMIPGRGDDEERARLDALTLCQTSLRC